MFAVGVSSPLIDDRFVIHQVEDAPKKLDCGPGFTLCAIFHNHIGMTAAKVANMTEKFLLRKHACIAQPCPNFNGLGKDLFRNCHSGVIFWLQAVRYVHGRHYKRGKDHDAYLLDLHGVVTTNGQEVEDDLTNK